MKQFSLKPIAALISGLAIAGISPAVTAQDATNPSLIEEVMVTGYARSIQNALDVKRNADTVVQAISSDDLGALPDVSIADALGRVPGITVTRSDGQAGTIQVRGMGEGFVFSTLNGREQVSPNGTRAMEFSQFPSELIQSVEVYMSPKASLIEGGVAGSVELKTANPLDMTEDQRITLGVRGSFNDQADDIYGADAMGSRLSLSLQKKFLDDTLGVSLGYAHLNQPRASARFEHYNYEPQALPLYGDDYLGVHVVDRNFNELPASERPLNAAISDGFELFQTGGDETRDGFVGAINFEPNEQWKFGADVFYSKFTSESYSRGFRVQPLRNAQINSIVLHEGGIIGGEFAVGDSAPTALNLQINSNDVTQENELLSGGFNVGWSNDGVQIAVDVSHSEASGHQADGVARAYLYTPLDNAVPGRDAFTRDADQSVSYLLDGINIPSVALSGADRYASYDGSGVSSMRLANYERYPRINEDVLDAIRVDAKFEFDWSFIKSVDTGVRYSERNHKDRRQVFVYGGYFPTDFSLPITTENSKIVNWKGDFSHMPSFLAIDDDKIIKQAVANGLVLGEETLTGYEPRSIEPAARWGEDRDWSMKQRSDIDENVTAGYVQLNLETEILGRTLLGNIGLRHVRTEQSSVALVNVNGNPDAGAVEIVDELGESRNLYAYQRLGADYNHNLPSLNLNYQLTENDQLRFAAARVLSRAPINRLAAPDSEGSVSVNGTVATFNYGSNTSPYLKPFIADQIDISYEHYLPETNGAFVIAGYHREIKSFIQDISYERFDFRAAGFDVPDTWTINEGGTDVEVDVEDGTYSTAINNLDGGYIRGIEVSYTQTFNFLPGMWEGLGTSLSYSWTDSEITVSDPIGAAASSGNLPFPGLVENSANATIFYSYDNFETRVSVTFQDEFVGETRNINLQPIVYAAETVVDYQASYKFGSGVDMVFSVNNLTNEPNRSFMYDEQFARTLQWFGRTYYLGVNYSF